MINTLQHLDFIPMTSLFVSILVFMSSLKFPAPLVENEESLIFSRPGLLIRVSNKNYFSYFSSKNICCGYSKEFSQ